MGVYCFDISPHEVQHAVVPTHIVTTTDLVQIHAPSSPNKCIHPRPTHTHLERECENDSSENRNHFQRRNSRRSRTCMSQPTARCVYVRNNNLWVPLLPGIITQSGCTIWCTNDKDAGYCWGRDYFSTPRGSATLTSFELGHSATLRYGLGVERNKHILRPLECSAGFCTFVESSNRSQ